MSITDPAATSFARGSHSASRGTSAVAKRSFLRRHPNPTDENIEDHTANIVNEPCVDIMKGKVSDLTGEQRKARTFILKLTSSCIRNVTEVGVKDKWPIPVDGILPERQNEQTGETYINPAFHRDVKHTDNWRLLVRVCDIIYTELSDEKTRPDFMNNTTMRITADTVYELAKVSWNGYKEAYRGQVEDGKRELKEDWKRRLAAEAGMRDLPDTVLDKLGFFEIIRPNWRSVEYSDILHKLWDYFWEDLPPKDRQEFKQRVHSENRSSDDPPSIAPFDFGINRDWYEQHKDKYPHSIMLHDWFSFGDPIGFGTRANETRQGVDLFMPFSNPLSTQLSDLLSTSFFVALSISIQIIVISQ
ncbi:hypothetical protein SCP_0604330 [Sparassis crispa]|uniref:Uncharacterized protein n=1 Tax=Sparassis crispa TaxID=139825 RepID=A0A401GRU9_9APHY|nr:hypothetical protein SCP_0604330 [Sparassis crispa]GBE84454.1 hypothetical protein SCP_0604330 [Sparassis crispa]